MKVELLGLGKKFNKEWIFRDLNYSFEDQSITAITGNNGSGKSTLLRLISSFSDPTLGKIKYSINPPNHSIGYVAPYLELIEELTLWEHLEFHFQFRKTVLAFDEMITEAGLKAAINKPITDFSSGMKQRVKLLLAFFSQDQLLLLDEPCSNLDETGIQWYQNQLKSIISTRTIIIASNQRFEYDQCTSILSIENFKR